MENTQNNRQIIILTDKGNTLKTDYSIKDKIKEVYGGNFLEMGRFYEKLRRLHERTNMFVLISNDEFIDAESEYSATKKRLARKSLQEVLRTNQESNILFILNRESFDYLYSKGLRDVILNLKNKNLIFVGATSIKSKLVNDGIWSENCCFFKRRGVARIGKINQNQILEVLGLKVEV